MTVPSQPKDVVHECAFPVVVTGWSVGTKEPGESGVGSKIGGLLFDSNNLSKVAVVVDSVKRCQQLWGTQCLVGGIDRRKEMNSKIALSDSVPVYILVGQVRTVVIQSFAYLDPTCNPAVPKVLDNVQWNNVL